jgi:hypothetical protein
VFNFRHDPSITICFRHFIGETPIISNSTELATCSPKIKFEVRAVDV